MPREYTFDAHSAENALIPGEHAIHIDIMEAWQGLAIAHSLHQYQEKHVHISCLASQPFLVSGKENVLPVICLIMNHTKVTVFAIRYTILYLIRHVLHLDVACAIYPMKHHILGSTGCVFHARQSPG